ncbi:beta-lactamase family protein [Rouxiella badensis]|uniref:Serine hydrolase n=1 Tax=Rouxiella badensis TaxID=1646377 RepID=A0A1X0WE32_9GAMM|nr:serine hydrolase domain-containing protein [Rouxiella badensis]MCC3749046.1 beta-lactamase family protein [Rouxiella badensis]ORJ25032.1 serine hydrolase [Rouxiella badensis]WAT03768.1 serine hydrolase [Rouxiella badensis]
MTSRVNWQAALDAAQKITQRWNQPGEPGGAITLFDSSTLRGEACGGLANLTTGEQFSIDSVVRYASVTKHIFAALALLRSHAGLSTDDPLGQHLPQLKGPMAKVTLGQALDMTGGLPDVRETLSLLGISVYNVTEADALIDFLATDGSLNFAAGTEISYSNTGYRLVETILKQKGILFEDLLQRHIAQPLDIAFHAPESWFDIVPNLVPGYWKSATGWKTAAAGLHLSASGSLTGSLRSLSSWLQSLLKDSGPGAGVLKHLSQPRFLKDGTPTAYGLGIAHSKIGGHQLVGHGGSHAGYKTYFLLHPELQMGAALVSNREDTASFTALLEVMSALLETPLPARSTSLKDGLYASKAEPYWLSVNNGVASYLGASENLYQAEDGSSVSLSAHLPMRLEMNGDAIEGEIGLARRFFAPIEANDCLNMIQGRWFHPESKAAFDIEGDELKMGIGPLRASGKLVPVGEGRLLVKMPDGPWEKSFCLYFQGYDVHLISNRSRVLIFRRDECRISWEPTA